ncbi:MAG: hypothetical protein HFJ17_02575 [Clostridia bacterium]|nr:hypothetical protein [Clostridia bacterium]
MEYIVLIIFLCLILIGLKFVYKVNIKNIKAIGENKILDEKTSKFPSNIEICKNLLENLQNENVTIEEDKNASNCLYIVTTNKILIGDVKQSFTRIQTIAHECLHSIQDKRILMFNFIYSNIYLLAFLTFCILTLLDVLPYKMMFLVIYILMGFIFYFVRSYLENDAMIKARYLAKEYMEEQDILSKQDINEIIDEYDKLNDMGIKATNYNLLVGVIVKTIILCILMI